MFDFSTLLVAGISLIIVIFGLVEFSKCLGLKGKALTVFSMLLGVVFGSAYKISESGACPTDFAGWFAVIVFGLALGLVTSGIYDFANHRLIPIG